MKKLQGDVETLETEVKVKAARDILATILSTSSSPPPQLPTDPSDLEMGWKKLCEENESLKNSAQVLYEEVSSKEEVIAELHAELEQTVSELTAPPPEEMATLRERCKELEAHRSTDQELIDALEEELHKLEHENGVLGDKLQRMLDTNPSSLLSPDGTPLKSSLSEESLLQKKPSTQVSVATDSGNEQVLLLRIEELENSLASKDQSLEELGIHVQEMHEELEERKKHSEEHAAGNGSAEKGTGEEVLQAQVQGLLEKVGCAPIGLSAHSRIYLQHRIYSLQINRTLDCSAAI